MLNDFSFASLAGQPKVKNLLARTLGSGRMPHAYLFRGPDGVGKKFAALLTAARINCAAPDDYSGCGTCSSCRKLRSGNHPDVVIVSPDKGSIKIDRVRELCRSLSFPPYESVMRVVIIEDVHAMTTEAGNSLLKTLEEPPENNLLILTAESSRELLPTIVSRCQTLMFYGLPVGECARVIGQKLPEIGPDEARLLAELAGGSPGTALTLNNKELVGRYRAVVKVVETASAVGVDGVTPVLETAAALAALKEDLPLMLGLLRMWVRDLMTEGDHIEIDIQKRRLAALDRAQRQLDRNCNRTLVSEVLLFNLQSPVAEVF
ncbi:MAG: DNA polymerase III subunit delta' [Desulfofustis sp.]|nr:DNA polymerase III subunit delta' [Desulfofustis sp.]